MRGVALIIVTISLSNVLHEGAKADPLFVAPAPQGSDSNNCRSEHVPCATFQWALGLCPVAQHCVIYLGAGLYSQHLDVVHFAHVSIVGNRQDGVCADRHAVTIDDTSLDGNNALFTVEDHATLTLSCMTLAAHRGNSGFHARQFAIGDLVDIEFASFPGRSAVSASETSKINVANPSIAGNANRFAYAMDLSQIDIGGVVKIADGLRFDVALIASINNSVVAFRPESMEGGAGFSGASYQCTAASIEKTVVLPGGDRPYNPEDGCTINGVDRRWAALGNQIDGVLAENVQLRNEIDGVQHDQNVRRRRDRAFAVTIAALFLALGAFGYRRLARLIVKGWPS